MSKKMSNLDLENLRKQILGESQKNLRKQDIPTKAASLIFITDTLKSEKKQMILHHYKENAIGKCYSDKKALFRLENTEFDM